MKTPTTLLSIGVLLVSLVGLCHGQARPYSDQAQLSSSDYQKVLALTPEVRFHPYELYYPSSIQSFLQNGKLVTPTGTIASPTMSDLAAHAGGPYEDTYVSLMNDWSDPNRVGNVPDAQQRVNAPMYFRVFDRGDHGIWIDFLFFYPYNGSQNMRVKYRTSTFDYHYRTLRFRHMATHIGDFEHVTLYVSRDLERVYSIATYQHGDPVFHDASEVEFDDSHPIVYSARDSHASYVTKGHHMTPILEEELGAIVGPILDWGMNFFSGLLSFEWENLFNPLPDFKEWNLDDQACIIKDMQIVGANWRPWEAANPQDMLIQYGVDQNGLAMSEFGTDALWVNFKHRWGASRLIGPWLIDMPTVSPLEGHVAMSDRLQAWNLFTGVSSASVIELFFGGDVLEKMRDGNGISPPDWWMEEHLFTAPLPVEIALSDAAGFGSSPSYYETIQSGDLDGDGSDEILYRSAFGLHVSRRVGNDWVELSNMVPLSNAAGFDDHSYYSTIQCADIDGDGSEEILVRGALGVVAITLVNDQFIQLPGLIPFSNATGWNAPQYYSTIQCADIDGDGAAEVVARSAFGVSAFKHVGTAFVALPGLIPLSNATGWGAHQYYSTIQCADIDGDGRDEVLARSAFGMLAYKHVGTAFVALPGTVPLSNAAGWGQHKHYSTIQCADLDGDGRAELVARGAIGLVSWRFTGSSWLEQPGVLSDWSNMVGFDQERHYATIQTADVDGDGTDEVLARGAFGMVAYKRAGSAWSALPRLLPFGNETFGQRSNWSTIQTLDSDGDGRAEVMGRSAKGLGIAVF